MNRKHGGDAWLPERSQKLYFFTLRKEFVMPTATLTSKGQITTPQAVRDAMGVHAGSKVDFVPVADGFKLVPHRNEAASLQGRFAGRVPKPVSIAAMDQAIGAGASQSNIPGKR
jgi:antitoxin PrlF